MNSRFTRTISASRVILLITLLTMELASALQTASAVDYPVLQGSGYEGQPDVAMDYPVLIGSGYEGHAAVTERETAAIHENADIDSVLAGSGYENQAAVAGHDQETTSTLETDRASHAAMIDAVLAGSGYEVDAAVAAAAD